MPLQMQYSEETFAKAHAAQNAYIEQIFGSVEYLDQLYTVVQEKIKDEKAVQQQLQQYEQQYNKQLVLIQQTQQKISETLDQVDVDDKIYEKLQEFTEAFLLPESVLQILQGEFSNDFEYNLPKLIDVINHPNFKFLYDKFQEKQGDDTISNLFKLMSQVEKRIIQYYTAILQPTKDTKQLQIKTCSFQDLGKFKYLLTYLYKINPNNQDIIENMYFQYRQQQIKSDIEQMQIMLKQYVFEQISSNDYFFDNESISDLNLFMPLIQLEGQKTEGLGIDFKHFNIKDIASKLTNKKFIYEKDLSRHQQIFEKQPLEQFSKDELQNELLAVYINSYCFNNQHNNRNKKVEQVSINKKASQNSTSSGIKVSANSFECQVFPEQISGYLIEKMDNLLVSEKALQDSVLYKSKNIPFEQTLIDQLEAFLKKLIFSQFDFPAFANFFISTKQFMERCKNQNIIMMLNKTQVLCGYGLLLKYKAIFGNFIKSTEKEMEAIQQYIDMHKAQLENFGIRQEFTLIEQSAIQLSKYKNQAQCVALFDGSLLIKTLPVSPILGFRIGYFLRTLKQCEKTSLTGLFDSSTKLLRGFLNDKVQQIFQKVAVSQAQEYCFSFLANMFAIINKVAGFEVGNVDTYIDQLKLMNSQDSLVLQWVKK